MLQENADGGSVTRYEKVKRFIRSRTVNLIGAAIILVFVIIAIFADYIAPYDPRAIGIPFEYPSSEHILGTNDLGQDIFSQTVYGLRPSLIIGIVAATISLIIGVTLGIIAGYFRGIVEDVILGITDIFLIVPGLPLMVLISVYMEPSIWRMVVIVALLWWCGITKVVHSKVIQVREMDFVYSSKSIGFSHSKIMGRHIFRNITDVVFAKYATGIASAMVAEASLAFIGLGDPFHISLGTIINHATARGGFALGLWWWYLIPGTIISILSFSSILLSWNRKHDKVVSDI